MDDEKYTCLPYSYVDERNGKYLVMWSDIPMWMVVDRELYDLMQCIDGRNTLFSLSVKFNTTVKKMHDIVKYLVSVGVVYRGERKPKNKGYVDRKISSVLVHPTNRCNLRCVHCCNSFNMVSKKDEISVDVIKNFLDQTLPFIKKDAFLSIIGGEPLLEMDKVLEISRYAKKIGYGTVGISTNGILVTKDFAKKAKQLNMEVQVSLDGVSAKENDAIRGKGTFKKIINAIKILKEEGVFVITNYTCTIDNYKSLEKYIQLALDLGVDCARFGPMKRIGSGTDLSIETLPVDKLLEHAYNIIEKHPEYKKLLGKDYFSAFTNSCKLCVKYPYCGTGFITVLLNPDGNVYPCTGHALPEFLVGNVKDSLFSDMWKNSPVLKKIRSTYPVDSINDKCSHCFVRYWCMGGCRAEAYQCTKSMNEPAVECESIKKAIIETIWRINFSPNLVKDGSHVFH